MTWLSRFLSAAPAAPTNRDASDDFWFGAIGAAAASGEAVTVDAALTVPVVYGCCNVLSETIGALPFGIFGRAASGDKERADGHPIGEVLRDPNEEETGVEFLEQMIWDLSTEGDFFAEIKNGGRGFVDRLLRLEPNRVTVERAANGEKRYRYSQSGAATRILLAEEVWHIKRPPSRGGLRGTSPIHLGREAIGAAIALQKYAARFFANDATPPIVIEHPGHFADQESKKNYLDAWRRWAGGRNRHSPAIVEHGMKVNRVGVTNDEAQFLQTRQQLNVELTRLWRIPPHKVGILDRATFSNIEEQSLDFVVGTLLPWLRLVEQSVNKHLIGDRRTFFEFNVAGLLRGDLSKRFAAYSQARQWGWLSVNEVRRLENMNSIGPAGDAYLQPMNMAPAGQQRANAAAEAVDFLRQSTADERPSSARRPSNPQLRVVQDAA